MQEPEYMGIDRIDSGGCGVESAEGVVWGAGWIGVLIAVVFIHAVFASFRVSAGVFTRYAITNATGGSRIADKRR